MEENVAESADGYVIISKDVGTSSDAKEKELEVVLEKEYPLIVVEPRVLGDYVIRWIKAGNFLHKSSVLSNLGALILLPFVSRRFVVYTVVPLGAFGISCALVYNISWHRDPLL